MQKNIKVEETLGMLIIGFCTDLIEITWNCWFNIFSGDEFESRGGDGALTPTEKMRIFLRFKVE